MKHKSRVPRLTAVRFDSKVTSHVIELTNDCAVTITARMLTNSNIHSKG